MLPAKKHHPDYVIDSEGHKRAVILSIQEYEELLKDLNDLAAIAERRGELIENYGLAKLMDETKNDERLSGEEAKQYYQSLK